MVPKMVFLFFLVASFVGLHQASGNGLKIVPEKEYRQGTVVILKDGEEGTICDKWVHYLGWPNALCRQMGFPLSDAVAYSKYLRDKNTGKRNRFRVGKKTPIVLESPNDCKDSLKIPVAECPEKETNGACNHKYDVFVRCRSKVRCRKDNDTYAAQNSTTSGPGPLKEKISCVPEYYKDGIWTRICDRNPPAFYTDLTNTWMSAFCSELGYPDGAVEVQNAVDEFANYTEALPIGLYTPQCNTSPPQIMDQCPSGLPHTVCDPSCDYWITCQRNEGYEDPYEVELPQQLNFKDSADTVVMPPGIILDE